MAIYRVKGPDGSIYRLQGPDDATDEQVTAAAAQVFGSASAPKPAVQDQASMSPLGSNLQNFAAGAGKAIVDTGRGIKQILDVPATYLEKQFPSSTKLAALLGLPTAQESAAQTQSGIDESKRLDEPLMNTKAGVAGNIAGNALIAAAPGAIGARMGGGGGGMLPRLTGIIAPSAASGAVQGAVQPVETGGNRAENAITGTVGGAIGGGLAKGIGKAAQGASSTVSQAVKDLADKAAEHGITIRADQLVNSKPLNVVSSVLESVPFSGMGAAKTAQQKQLNTAISKTIGQNTDNLVTAMKQAEDQLGSKFDAVLKTNSVKADDALLNGLSKIQQDARNELTGAQYGVVQRQIDNLLGKVKQGDVIDADAAYNIKKGLDRISGGNDTSLAHYAADMRVELMDALNRSLPSNVAKDFAQTRQQYRNMIELRKLVPAGAEGDITPARLANANTSGPLSELSDISAQFLKGRVGDSGTAQRAAVLAGLGGLGFGGIPLAPVAAGLTAGRATTEALKSNALRNYLMNGSPSLGKVSRLSQILGPAAGAPVAIEANK